MYKEVSAKDNINIKELFFQSVVTLPFFQQFKSDQMNDKQLLEQLEFENADFNYNTQSNNIGDSSRINISMIDSASSNHKCKC